MSNSPKWLQWAMAAGAALGLALGAWWLTGPSRDSGVLCGDTKTPQSDLLQILLRGGASDVPEGPWRPSRFLSLEQWRAWLALNDDQMQTIVGVERRLRDAHEELRGMSLDAGASFREREQQILSEVRGVENSTELAIQGLRKATQLTVSRLGVTYSRALTLLHKVAVDEVLSSLTDDQRAIVEQSEWCPRMRVHVPAQGTVDGPR